MSQEKRYITARQARLYELLSDEEILRAVKAGITHVNDEVEILSLMDLKNLAAVVLNSEQIDAVNAPEIMVNMLASMTLEELIHRAQKKELSIFS